MNYFINESAWKPDEYLTIKVRDCSYVKVQVRTLVKNDLHSFTKKMKFSSESRYSFHCT